MNINAAIDKPIFQQIREGIEDSILQGHYKEGEQIPSITEYRNVRMRRCNKQIA